MRNNYKEIEPQLNDWDKHQMSGAFGRLTESNFGYHRVYHLSTLKRPSKQHLSDFSGTQSRLRTLREEVVSIIKEYYRNTEPNI